MERRRPSWSEYEPFIDDPKHIALLDGQRYVVLRPTSAVPGVHDQVRTLVRTRLDGLPVSYPARAHVTLTGFPKGTELQAIRELVAQWAGTIAALQLEVERVGCFPPPHQVVIVQIRKTPELFEALVSLRDRSREQGLRDLTVIPPVDWVFHMSVAYCSSLTADAWAEVSRFVEHLDVPAAQCVVGEVEIAAFDNGREHSGGAFVLSGGRLR